MSTEDFDDNDDFSKDFSKDYIDMVSRAYVFHGANGLKRLIMIIHELERIDNEFKLDKKI